MTFDHWKTTELEYTIGDTRPSPDEEHIAYLGQVISRYEAALRKIAEWKGWEEKHHAPSQLANLQRIAAEALE